MSFTEEKRDAIKRYILEKIDSGDTEYIRKTMDSFGISVTTVKRYISECLQDGTIKEDPSPTGYGLVTEAYEWSFQNDGGLVEDKIYFETILPHLKEVTEEARQIWNYAFSEIMNNAIEHSGSSRIVVCCRKNELYTEISIVDDGIGIFRNICDYLLKERQYKADIQDAVTELHKGKLTTMPERHSGEGIFFSAKMMRNFVICSDDALFSGGCMDKDKLVQSHLLAYYTKLNRIGTMVVMRLENQTRRSVKEIFNSYAPLEEGFVKTVLPIRNICPYGEPVARSQARRILYRLEEFREVELDFAGIEFIGQGFADEVFRVFQNRHPEIVFKLVNANESVLGMVKHVL